MHRGSILAKTQKGLEEMASRSHGLSPRLRAALIMADGETDVATLLSRCGELAVKVEFQFAELVANGFLEDIVPREQAEPIAAPASAASRTASPQTARPVFRDLRESIGNAALHESLPIEATREMLELFVEKLDADAVKYSDGVIRCETAAETVEYLEEISAPLRATIGDADATELMRRAQEILARYS
jgi:hypothetical protein